MFNSPAKSGSQQAAEPDKSYFSPPPAVSLPKGGGAIKGMGEKFAANPVTGTGSMTVPLATSAGRSVFGPQLSLSYDSGAGNGPFGFGWSLSLPAITRKTDKGLPKYQDAEESDVFILSGAEDLVPVYRQDPNGSWIAVHAGYTREPITHWVRDPSGQMVIHEEAINGYIVRRYRPRIEGLFARLERWTKVDSGETHWRSISKDNITTLYGKTGESRIADPDNSTHVFSWSICESYDDKGNAIIYEYKSENAQGVNLSLTHEQNRTDSSRGVNRYLKHIKYGNRTPRKSGEELSQPTDWLFEVVFDYGEHDLHNPKPNDTGQWLCRHDPFSSYRAGFEVRTYRLCQRVLIFHHFSDETEVGQDCLVRSLDLIYRNSRNNPADLKQGHPIASFITSLTQTGYKRDGNGYLCKSLPPLEFEYTEAVIAQDVQTIAPESLVNLPYGLDGRTYQWVDLDGEGISGILTEQAGAWFYKSNLGDGHFGSLEKVAAKPSLAALSSGRQQLLDLAGDGQLDLAEFGRPTPGFYERTQAEGWENFKPFVSLPNVNWADPNLRFVDLNGDGHADVLITEQVAFTWYPSLAEAGFGRAQRLGQSENEETGPRLVFADGTQSIYLADLSGDGLIDLVRIRNGEVCYWPNLGYGRFGAKVTMDNAPWFDHPELFDQKRVRLGDIDGSGTTDIFYLGSEGITLWFNQSGNSWSQPHQLQNFPRIDDLTSVAVADLLGNGTACLVWSSPLPGDARQPMRYLDLMGGQKPHLLVLVKNNLGAQTRVQYAPSTRFYLEDRAAGQPWITKLPFPVHVVERVETYDRITGNKFVTTYRYHHGYYDGLEREFRGFGLVEQWDTETYPAFQQQGLLPVGSNALEEPLHVPPAHTKTWFHTGAYIDRHHISNFFAEKEYYREPQYRLPSDADGGQRQEIEAQFQATLLADTILPLELTAEEEGEACRALKGSMLRQEVYALDGTDKAEHPYTVTEQNFTIVMLQGRGDNRHGVFFTHAREAINYYYERHPNDPRVSHAMTLEVDEFGNVLKSVAIAYPRRQPQYPEQGLIAGESTKGQPLVTYTENQVTNEPAHLDWYRIGVPIEIRTYEITGLEVTGMPVFAPFTLGFIRDRLQELENRLHQPAMTPKPEIAYEEFSSAGVQRRLIEQVRTLYRANDQANTVDPVCLPLGEIQSLALPCESLKIAFTPGLLKQVFGDKQSPDELKNLLRDEGKYIEQDGAWWIPSGRQAFAPQQFYLPVQTKDPFGQPYTIEYDKYHLLAKKTIDPLNNVVEIENNYRVMQPQKIVDPNGNRARVAFDALGMVVGTAVMGKKTENKGDPLDDFRADLSLEEIRRHIDNPLGLDDPTYDPHLILQDATTRLVYDLDRYRDLGQPAVVCTLARETHSSEPDGDQTKIQQSFLYSDGFGRELQTKIQAEPGEAPRRDADGELIRENDQLKLGYADSRWVGTGRKIYNNKGKPVKQYEPFFSSTHQYETEQDLVEWGVTPVIHYDPLERVIRTDLPNGTFSKVEFDAWQQVTWDENDTVLESDWYAQRQALPPGNPDRRAALMAAEAQKLDLNGNQHGTPTVAHLDILGRTFLTIADNGINKQGERQLYSTHVELDIEGNQLAITDGRGNQIMVNAIVQKDEQGKPVRDDQGKFVLVGRGFDLLGHNLYSYSADAGERWLLNNVAGKPMRQWNGRGFQIRTTYDKLQRPSRLFVQEGTKTEVLAERTVYGEELPDAVAHNLRGKVYQQYDGAGVVTNEEFDFKGNLLRGKRQLLQVQDCKGQVNWSDNPFLEEVFTTSTTYDALNRPTSILTPDKSETRPTYNEANLLNRVDVRLRGAADWTEFVTNIDYNAKGQRILIVYGNGVTTEYHYYPDTFRLHKLFTRREQGPWLQNLHYTYDPVGNITEIRDYAQQTIFFNNAQVEPVNQYVYDALYRLTEATGREHLGQKSNGSRESIPLSHDDSLRMNRPHPNDEKAMGRYEQQYVYDEVGNILEMIHQGEDSAQVDWRRCYQYAPDSNRLLSTEHPNDPTVKCPTHYAANPVYGGIYIYDDHGNMTQMPHLQGMEWDFKDQLRVTQKQVVNNGNSAEKTYYVYDAAGQRVRKVTERANGTLKDERIYLGGFEIYRAYNGDGSSLKLERETLHVMDGEKRIALVETQTVKEENGVSRQIVSPKPIILYQFGNHLGSASLELDEGGNVISYEEYYPYGSTSYQAGRNVAEVSLKRYRYTGKERDEESGLYYYGARYYAAWLGRWISCDPAGMVEGNNLYTFSKNNPIVNIEKNGMTGEKLEFNLFSEERLDLSQYPSLGNLKLSLPIQLTIPPIEPHSFLTPTGSFSTNQNLFMTSLKTLTEEYYFAYSKRADPNLQSVNFLPPITNSISFEMKQKFRTGQIPEIKFSSENFVKTQEETDFSEKPKEIISAVGEPINKILEHSGQKGIITKDLKEFFFKENPPLLSSLSPLFVFSLAQAIRGEDLTPLKTIFDIFPEVLGDIELGQCSSGTINLSFQKSEPIGIKEEGDYLGLQPNLNIPGTLGGTTASFGLAANLRINPYSPQNFGILITFEMKFDLTSLIKEWLKSNKDIGSSRGLSW